MAAQPVSPCRARRWCDDLCHTSYMRTSVHDDHFHKNCKVALRDLVPMYVQNTSYDDLMIIGTSYPVHKEFMKY